MLHKSNPSLSNEVYNNLHTNLSHELLQVLIVKEFSKTILRNSINFFI